MISYAQNFEDVMLERLFQGKRKGLYVDVGAWDPDRYSVTRHFYMRGWRGLNIEPIASRYDMFVKHRPRDINVHGLVGAGADMETFFECVEEDYLSTTVPSVADLLRQNGRTFREYAVSVGRLDTIIERHCPKAVIDFLKLDVEGAEAEVLKTIDLSRHRPRALVIEATLPGSGLKSWDEPEANGSWSAWEEGILQAGYVFVLFDGLNRFYLRDEDRKLGKRLALPPGVYDGIDCSQGPQNVAAERLEVIERQHVEIEELRSNRERALASGDQLAGESWLDQQRVQELTAKLEESNADRARRLIDAESLSALLEERQAAFSAMSVDVARQVEVLEADRAARGEVIEGLEGQVGELGREGAARLEAIERLSADLTEARAMLGSVAEARRAEVAVLEADRAARGEVIEGLESQIGELGREGAARLEAIERLSADLTEARAMLGSVAEARRAEVAVLEADRAARGEVIEGLESQVGELGRESAARLEAIERLSADLTEARAMLGSVAEARRAEVAVLEADRAARGEVIEGLESQVGELGRESAARLEAIERLSADLTEARAMLGSVAEARRAEVAVLEADRAARGEVIEGLESQVGELGREGAARLEAIERLSADLTEARAMLGSVAEARRAEVAVLEADRAARGEVIEGLREQLGTLYESWMERFHLINFLDQNIRDKSDEAEQLARLAAERLDQITEDAAKRVMVEQQLANAMAEIDVLKRRWPNRLRSYVMRNA